MPRALLSVSDKTNLPALAAGLTARGFELVSTGGTARLLQQSGLPVLQVADVTGFPEMMDGRVKTLHPAIHAGILARRDRPSDVDAATRQAVALIDVVVVNLYPFAAAAANPETHATELIEEIDIGGPTLVRAAAKNFRDVLVVVDPQDYDALLDQIDRAGGATLEYRLGLAQKAFAHTAEYDATIAATLTQLTAVDGTVTRAAAAESLPRTLLLSGRKVRDLRYGENPHQRGAWYSLGGTAFGNASILQGKELSFTNLLDLDAAARLAFEFDRPAAVVIKHTNPCGAAVADSAAEAYVRAREADPVAAFGGIVGLNREIDVDTAEAIVSTFIEAVAAPSVHADARRVLSGKPNLRVVTADFAAPAFSLDFRSVLGAVLAQSGDVVDEAGQSWPTAAGEPRVVTRRAPTTEEWAALRFAWKVCAHVKSNAIVFTSRDRTLAIGAGQMSRVDAVRVATMKGGERLRGGVAASDAFFPFRDGVDAVAAAGATALAQPGGSVRDTEAIAAADEHGLAMVFTGRRHFRH